MSEHIQKSDHAARQSRRGGKRLAAGQAERERKCPPTPPEVQPEPRIRTDGGEALDPRVGRGARWSVPTDRAPGAGGCGRLCSPGRTRRGRSALW